MQLEEFAPKVAQPLLRSMLAVNTLKVVAVGLASLATSNSTWVGELSTQRAWFWQCSIALPDSQRW